MAKKKTRRKRCKSCQKLYDSKDMIYDSDPYAADIEQDYTKVWLCKECYNTLCDDI